VSASASGSPILNCFSVCNAVTDFAAPAREIEVAADRHPTEIDACDVTSGQPDSLPSSDLKAKN
jgi:hypothetical protein